MLEDPKLDLQKTIDICRASENARATCADIRAPASSVSRLSAYRRGRSRSRGALPSAQPRGRPAVSPGARCRRCGRGAHADPAACRAANAACNSCNRYGHFAVMCEQGARGDSAAPATAPASERGRPARKQQSTRNVRRVLQDVFVSGVSSRPTPTVGVNMLTPDGVFTLVSRADRPPPRCAGVTSRVTPRRRENQTPRPAHCLLVRHR